MNKNKAILTALLAAVLLATPNMVSGQEPVQRGVRVGDNISAVNDAAVTAGGIVSAAENSTVTVTTAAAPAGKVAKVTVRKITDVAMTSFAVSGDAEANNGTDKTYTIADIVPSYADLTGVTWSVEDGTAATIGETTGVLHPTGIGTVTVTATSTHNPSLTASKEVTIGQGWISITGVSLSSTSSLYSNGVADIATSGTDSSFGITPTVAPSGATDKTVTWTQSSSNGGQVYFGTSGTETTATGTSGTAVTVRAAAVGTVTITCTATNGTEDTSDDVSTTCTVTVWNGIIALPNNSTVNLAVAGKWLIKGTGSSTSSTVDIKAANVELTFRNVNMTGATDSGPIICGNKDGIVLNFEGTNTITASGAYAGIKCASSKETTINVKSGTTTITGGSGCAGIGSVENGTCGGIFVKDAPLGSSLTVIGGENAAGIGCGNGGTCGDITIIPNGYTGANSNVTVKGNIDGSNGSSNGDIGMWGNGTTGTITINGHSISSGTQTNAIKGRGGSGAYIKGSSPF